MRLKWRQCYFNKYLETNTSEKKAFLDTIKSLGLWYYVRSYSPFPEFELQCGFSKTEYRKLKGLRFVFKDNGEIDWGFPDDSRDKTERKIEQSRIKDFFSLYQKTLGALYKIGMVYFDDDDYKAKTGNGIDLLSAELIRSIQGYEEQHYCPSFAKSILKKTILDHEELVDYDELRECYKRVIILPDEPRNLNNPKW